MPCLPSAAKMVYGVHAPVGKLGGRYIRYISPRWVRVSGLNSLTRLGEPIISRNPQGSLSSPEIKVGVITVKPISSNLPMTTVTKNHIEKNNAMLIPLCIPP